jgi:hypothetical protein
VVGFFQLALICPSATAQQFENEIHPLLAKYCFDCHGAKKQEGDLRLDRLPADWSNLEAVSHWVEVRDQLNLGEMPPKKANRKPTAEELAKLVDWVSDGVHKALRNGSAETQIVFRRLTKRQYGNTLRDLLGITLKDLEQDLPDEGLSAEGFKNNGELLVTSPFHIEMYQKIARRALDAAIVTGPKPEVMCSVPSAGLKFDYKVQVKKDGRKEKRFSYLPLYDDPEKPIEWYETDANGRKHFKRRHPIALCRLGGGAEGLDDGGVVLSRSYGVNPISQRRDWGPLYFDCNRFPYTGRFQVKVTAGATIPENAPNPTLIVYLGYDTEMMHRAEVGRVELTNSSKDLKEFVFTGHLENFPMPKPGKITKQSGLILTISSSYPTPQQRGTWGEPTILVRNFEFTAPFHDVWPPKSHTRLLPLKAPETPELEYVRNVLQSFMKRAFRRQVKEEEVARMLALYESSRDHYDSVEEAVKVPLAAVLCSPSFLYLSEPTNVGRNVNPTPKDGLKIQPTRLTDFELASRLSYFLWNTMPDAQLFELAGAGKLKDDRTLEAQVRRMLADPKAWSFVRAFADQWLNVEQIDSIAINDLYYRGFNDQYQKSDFKEEVYQFVGYVLLNNASCLDFVDSDYLLLDHRLASYYKIPGMSQRSGFQRVVLPKDSDRGGLLTMVAPLMTTTPSGQETSLVKRAVYFMDRILGTPPPPPPPNVPDFNEQKIDETLSIKQKLEIHRTKTACANCHRKIDSWGVLFESYDAVGRSRKHYFEERIKEDKGKKRIEIHHGPEIDDSAELSDGTPVRGVRGLKTYVLEQRKDALLKNVSSRLLSYALGRSLSFTDEPLVDELVGALEKDNCRSHALVLAIVKSKAFRHK